MEVLYSAADVDVLFITGMRDEAPVAAFSHLVPSSRLLEVRVKANDKTREARQRYQGDACESENKEDGKDGSQRPNIIFNNDATGSEAAERFFEQYLLPFCHEDLERLADMVHAVPNFPRRGIQFRDVLGISQQPGGLALCTSLLQSYFVSDWAKVNKVVCCETGGFVFASALAVQINKPLVLIRAGGKLPPPTISVIKSPSYISSSASQYSRSIRVEMCRGAVSKGASVVVVDDVLATGETLCAMLRLLGEAGIDAESVSVLAVAEFPVHRGRENVRQRGFGGVNIQSLLLFGGV